jgi:hypothetical protein
VGGGNAAVGQKIMPPRRKVLVDDEVHDASS